MTTGQGDITARITAIIAGQAVLPVADITPDSTPAGLGIDSLGMVQAIFAIEEAFDISIPFNPNDLEHDGFDHTTVAAITAAVAQLIADQHEQ